jgi:hypothetical protein
MFVGEIIPLVGLLVLLTGLIVIPITVWRVFKGAGKGVSTLFDKAEASRLHTRTKQRESRVFELAAANGGKVTVFQVARGSDMTLQEATEFLDSLVKAGAAEMVVNDSGTIEYKFPKE